MEQKDRMLAGKIYDPNDGELLALREKCHRLNAAYNTLSEDDPRRNEILDEMGIQRGKGTYLQGPIYFDYGCFTSFGERCYANFNLTVLDTCPVKVGNDVFLGVNVSLVTPLHPLRYQERNAYLRDDGVLTDQEYGKPIVIEDNCWIASMW